MTTYVHDLDDPRRDAIVRQARQHFITEGYAGTRMEPIAREAGVSTATLYAFFDSKAVLFEAVIENASVDFDRHISAVHADVGAPREQLTAFIAAYAEFMGDSFVRSVFRLVLAERHRFEALAARFFERGRSDFGAVLMRMLTEMTAAGLLKVEKPSWAAGQLMGMIEHPVFFVPLVTGDEVLASRSVRQIAEDAVETFLARYGT
ncbi:TetR/AcrR family transcriptional regulator C-terminal domain-containing protein [Brevundimonas faecalis]|uniref:TetR/AcrR family transcriptional regulator C-terminal domain-containing protein n=1 Tax=Brevundimonas faecalis TaxID=947378 RepID=UPI003612402D